MNEPNRTPWSHLDRIGGGTLILLALLVILGIGVCTILTAILFWTKVGPWALLVPLFPVAAYFCGWIAEQRGITPPH